jgi:hypothetical protein
VDDPFMTAAYVSSAVSVSTGVHAPPHTDTSRLYDVVPGVVASQVSVDVHRSDPPLYATGVAVSVGTPGGVGHTSCPAPYISDARDHTPLTGL